MPYPSLRTYSGEIRYQIAKKNGQTGNIQKLTGVIHHGLRLVPNEFPLDAFHDRSNMLLGKKSFWLFWIRLGWIYRHNKNAGHDQLLLNFPQSQSQPHVLHAHLLRFKKERKFFKL